MQKQQSYQGTGGKLYLVPTPIGNLADMTFRAVEALKEAALIAAEDTRNTQKLLNHFAIETPQISFHEHNYAERIPQLIEKLANGTVIAQVSDAGMPSISDPGKELVAACVKEEIPVISLPGATAGMTALIASGLPPQPFTFVGFLPRKKAAQKAALEAWQAHPETLIFYESPYRMAPTVKLFANVFGEERRAVICRELTKIHEEYLRGTLAELAEYTAATPLRGECILLVEGHAPAQSTPAWEQWTIEEHLEHALASGLTSKEAIKEVAHLRGLKKQVVYQVYHRD